jgi:hypothetical protein
MKKLIGVAIILLTLVLSVIYRQLTHRPAAAKPEQSYVPATMRDGMLLSYLILQ